MNILYLCMGSLLNVFHSVSRELPQHVRVDQSGFYITDYKDNGKNGSTSSNKSGDSASGSSADKAGKNDSTSPEGGKTEKATESKSADKSAGTSDKSDS